MPALRIRPKYLIAAAAAGAVIVGGAILLWDGESAAWLTTMLTTMVRRLAQLREVIKQHYVFAAMAYIAVFIALAGLSLPVAIYLSAVAGFLFGISLGAIYALCGATAGAALCFVLARRVFRHWPLRTGAMLETIKRSVRKSPFRSLLALRLMPGCPFVVVNLAAATLDIKFRTYVAATFVGILPSTLAQVIIGAGVRELVALGAPITPRSLALNPSIAGAFFALSILVGGPLVYRWVKRLRAERS